MKALILGAGYGTRLQRDLAADTTGKYEDLKNIPKPLLPIGGVSLVSRWMDILRGIVHDVYVVVSKRPL